MRILYSFMALVVLMLAGFEGQAQTCPANLGTTVNIASLPYSASGLTTCGAGNEITAINATICGSSSYYGGEDLVFIFTPTSSGSYQISLTSTSSWIGLMLYNGCPFLGQGGSCVGNTQSSTGSKTLTVTLTAGVTYYLVVDTWPSPTCIPSFDLSIAPPPPPPANDNCATATAFPVIPTNGTCVTLSNQTTANATASGVTPTGACTTNAGTPDDDIWFSFVAPASTVILEGTFVSGVTDVYWHVFSSACGTTMTSILCTDTNTGGTLTGLTVGATYYIRLYTWSSGVTTVQNVCLRTPAPPPANDECAGATLLTSATSCVTTAGTNSGATQSIAPITCATFTSASALDVWYRWVATATTHTVTVVGGTGFDAIIDIRSGACNGTNIGCADASLSGGTETVTLAGLTVGATYYARIYGWAGSVGTFTICVTNPALPPANDDCANAVSLTPGTTCVATSGTTVNATQSLAAITCATFTGTADDDVWYQFTATATSHIVTVVGSTGFDPVVDVRSGACNGTNINCADATVGGGTETVTLTGLTVGAVYYVRVYSFGSLTSNQGTFTICVTIPAPANDNCASATTLTPATTCNPVSGTTVGATQSLAAITCATFTGTADDDVWYQFTAVATNHTVTVVGSAGFDAVVDVRSGACNGSNINCADGTLGGGTETVMLTGLTVGTVYYVRVYSFGSLSGNQGTFTICVTFPAPSSNDDCLGAISLTPGATCTPTSGNTFGATQSLPPSTCGSFAASQAYDVWYSFVAAAPTQVVTVDGASDMDAVVELRSGACNGTFIACTDATLTDGIETITATGLTVGATYYVRLYDFFSNGGNYTICITTPTPGCLANPTAPTNGQTGICPGPITLSWPAQGAATSYDVYFGTSATPPFVANVAGTTYAAGSLAAGTYFWQIRPKNSTGTAMSCNIWSFTVNDNTVPTISCTGNITQSNTANQCGANVTFASATASDNCTASPTVVQIAGPTSGAFFAVGTTTVVFRATDGSGNTATCSFNVTINDTQAPVITCPANIVVNAAANQCSANVSFANATATDNCSATVSQIGGPASGSSFPVGITTVTFRAVDPSNNSATCTFTVRVNDTQLPVITCPANQVLNNTPNLCSAVATFANATATDNCSATVAQVGGLASGSTFPVGTSTITFRATDPSNNTAQCTFTIQVNDVQPPTISCPGDRTGTTTGYTCEALASSVNLGLPSSSDNCVIGGPPSNDAPASYPVGTTTVTWTVADQAGNTASCAQQVTILDLQLPVVQCPTSVVTATADPLESCEAIVDYAVTAYDNCPGVTLSSNHPPLSSFPLNTTIVTVTATDASGNSNFCTFSVFVGRATEVCNGIDDDCDGLADEADSWDLAADAADPGGVAGDQYGQSVAIDGNYAVVGTQNKNATGQSTGGAFLFSRVNGDWQQTDELDAPATSAGDNYGAAVAIAGAWAAVGAPNDDDVATDAGAIYLFEQNAGNPQLYDFVVKLTLPGGNQGDNLGWGLAMHGDYLLAGAVGDDQQSTDAGAVHVFGRNQGGANNWGLVGKLVAPFGAPNDQFGAAIDFDGEYAIVGATGDDQYGDNAGAAYVFGRNTGGANNWGFAAKLLAGDGEGADNFGSGVGISGDFAIVGADQQDDKGNNAGKAYAYYRNQWSQQNSWGQMQGIIDFNGQANDNFGASVAMEQNYAVIGAPGADVSPGKPNSGKAIVYQLQQGGWVPVDVLTATPTQTNGYFARQVALSNFTVLVGAPLEDGSATQVDKGAVEFFEGVCAGEDRAKEEPTPTTLSADKSLHCYPVPFSDRLTIRVAGMAAARVSVLNNLGQEIAIVYDGAIDGIGAQFEWDATRFEAGLYFVRMQTATGVQTQAVTLARR